MPSKVALKSACGFLAASALVLASQAQSAEQITVLADSLKVTTISSQASLFGGCTASLTTRLDSVTTPIGDCSNSITFDCLGTTGLVSKAQANQNFANAQLALVAQKFVRVVVDPDVKINGVCFSPRVDVFRGS